MRIALIGPAYPYRGGIAHHTAMLSEYLRRRGHSVDIINFRRQYPKALFPGKTQEEPDRNEQSEVAGERLIDSLNPTSWWKTGRLLRSREYDLHLVQHWLPFFGPAFGSIVRRAHRPGRGDVMIVVHNFAPHESRPGDRLLTRRLFKAASSAITQSSVVFEQVRGAYPDLPVTMQPHPVYENFGTRIDSLHARRMLGLPEDRKLLLFFGFIRKYKGLDLLIRAMPEIVRRVPDAHLVVAGEYYEDRGTYESAIAATQLSDRMTMHTEYVSNDDVKVWFSAADAIVLPYRNATNSGIVQIAYNFGVPAIVTDVGSLSEIVVDGSTGYVIPDAAPETIAHAVERIVAPGAFDRFARAIEAERAKYSWDSFAEAVEHLYAVSNERHKS